MMWAGASNSGWGVREGEGGCRRCQVACRGCGEEGLGEVGCGGARKLCGQCHPRMREEPTYDQQTTYDFAR